MRENQETRGGAWIIYGHGVHVPFWLRDLLMGPVEGKVFAVFQDVIDVKALDLLVGVASARVQPNPVTVITDLGIDFRQLTKIGDGVQISSGEIAVGQNIFIGYNESDLWASEPLHGPVNAPGLRPLIRFLKTLIKEDGRMEGAGPVIDYMMADHYPRAMGVPPPVRIYYEPLRKLMRHQASSILGGMRGLVGLGPGLTPSGDDVLIGFLAARSLLNGALHGTDICLDTFRRGIPLFRGRTTLLSEELLYWASRGQFGKPITDMMNSLADGDVSGVRASAIRMMTQFGATSGTDTLIGIVAGMS